MFCIIFVAVNFKYIINNQIFNTMKQFFKFMFASMLGFFLTSVIIFFILAGIFASMATLTRKDVVKVDKNSVLHLKFDKEIIDRGGRSPFEDFDFFTGRPSAPMGLNEIIENIRKAKLDDNITGIFLDLNILQAGFATTEEIRDALLDFKESDKFIISYGEVYSQNAYYLGSVADHLYLNPEGAIDFRGINAELIFFKHMLDRLGIDAQVIRHGEYKSAGEPFFLDEMSPENREQTLAFISSIWNNVVKGISETRSLSVNHLHHVADNLLTRTAGKAFENGMIDGIKYYDEVLDEIRVRLGLDEDDDINFITYSRYKNAPAPESLRPAATRDRIAVVYGMGSIISGDAGERFIASDRIAAAIRNARLDESVKAIVFRINSGGGSALASDVILREIKLAAKEKPVVATMGDVAASGGYYIACAADHIIAHPNTITGSIGVFGLIPNMKEFFNEKLGITFDNVKTNELSDFGSFNRPLTGVEEEIIREMIDEIYQSFINHVAEGRGLPVETIDEIGRGRVWSGVDAKRIGLIDDYGGLELAVERAAELAEIEKYRIVEYPKRKDFFTLLMEEFTGVHDRWIQRRLGDKYKYIEMMNEAEHMTGVQTRLPYEIILY